METKICKDCGRELPLSDFRKTRSGALSGNCNECIKEKYAQTRYSHLEKFWGGGKIAPFSDPDFDGKQPREVIDTMIRCRKWLESRGFEISMSCVYKEVKIRKINLE